MIDTRGLVIGELAVREGLLSREQLEMVTTIQQQGGFSQPLGLLMLEQRFISKLQLEGLLFRQKKAIADFEKSLSISGLFGRIAIERGFIHEKELSAAIRRQLELNGQGKHVRIGQVLLRMRAMTPVQFWEIIHAQGLFKCGACSHTLDTPRVEKNALLCEKCGARALALDED